MALQMKLYFYLIFLCLYDDVLQILCTMASFHKLYFVYKNMCFHIYIGILCKCQDVLMLLTFLRFSSVIFLPLTIMCFLSLVVGAGNWYLHFYHQIMAMPLLTLN